MMNYPASLVYEDGTELRLYPLEKTQGKPLYVSADGRCFSFCYGKLRLLKPSPDTCPKNRFNGHRKQRYLCLRQHRILVHIAVATVWIGPRVEGMECDHLNGITTDNRVSNLQWITPEENRKRATILRARRMIARQDGKPEWLPENMKPEELLALFSKYNVAGDGYDTMDEDMNN